MSESRRTGGGSGELGGALAAHLLKCTIDGAPVNVELSDVSAVGLFVQTPSPLPVDREVSVSLQLDDDRFQVLGHVVQSVSPERAASEARKAGYGLLFLDIDEGERARLRKRVDAALAQRTAASQRPPSTTHRPAAPAPRAHPAPAPAKPAASATPGPEEHALLAKLREELRALTGKPPWAVLGISQGSAAALAKEAYFAASKRYHPHQFSRHQLPEIKQVVTELFIAHKRAFDAMSRGSAPRSAIERASTRPPAQEPAPRPLSAAASLRPPSAAASLRPPAMNKPRTGDAERLVVDALKHVAQNRLEAAEADLDKALAIDSSCKSARIWLLVTQARRCKARGEHDAANAKYLEVLALDPKHHEALSETKKHGKSASERAPSLLSRVFGSGNGEK